MYKSSAEKQEAKPDSTKSSWTRWIPDPLIDSSKQKNIASQLSTTDKADQASELTKGEIQTKLKEALEEAHLQGKAQGYEIGYAQGHKLGKPEGHKQGYDEGYKEGFKVGHEKGATKAQEAAQNLNKLTQGCAQALNEIETNMGQAVIKLAVKIAEQVLHSTVKANPEKILDLISDMVRLNLDESKALQLYVNPADLSLVTEYLRNNPDTTLWRALPDESITPGGCKASTALGDIDATLEQRWRRVIATLGEL